VETRRPHFDLAAFKAACGDVGHLTITTTALRTAAGLGFSRSDIALVIRSMKPMHFLKSMTSYGNSKRWQDVYHVPQENMVLYVKFTDDGATGFAVLSFKER
jgi:motility quorum-sensing regulator/GCU-specific mRNA interferase toxin